LTSGLCVRGLGGLSVGYGGGSSLVTVVARDALGPQPQGVFEISPACSLATAFPVLGYRGGVECEAASEIRSTIGTPSEGGSPVRSCLALSTLTPLYHILLGARGSCPSFLVGHACVADLREAGPQGATA
jgi:hypothetical protein